MSLDTKHVIDWPDFEARCLNDAEFIQQMLGVFCDNTPKVWEQCKAAVEMGDWPAARRHAHTLKGSAANMSAATLRTLAMMAESKTEVHDKAGFNDIARPIDLAMHDCVKACTQKMTRKE
jgi:HPt (histidine-containing phosphotransfer) domain-containing protein